MTRADQNSGDSPLVQLIALNDEIAALVRAGVPLERSLVDIGRDLPGRSGSLAAALANRLENGEALLQILADDSSFPPLWRAVVRAGLRSGYLAAAVQGMATTGRRIAEMRQSFRLAMIYPAIVTFVAYILFVFVITMLVPITVGAYDDMMLAPSTPLRVLSWAAATSQWWIPGVPLVAVTAFIFIEIRLQRRSVPQHWTRNRKSRYALSRGLFLMPALHEGRMATYAEVLALLIEHQVPLHESLTLSGDACGDRGLARASREIAERLRRGGRYQKDTPLPEAFPSLLGWLLSTASDQPGLPGTLRMFAETYRRKASRRASALFRHSSFGLLSSLGISSLDT